MTGRNSRVRTGKRQISFQTNRTCMIQDLWILYITSNPVQQLWNKLNSVSTYRTRSYPSHHSSENYLRLVVQAYTRRHRYTPVSINARINYADVPIGVWKNFRENKRERDFHQALSINVAQFFSLRLPETTTDRIATYICTHRSDDLRRALRAFEPRHEAPFFRRSCVCAARASR